MRLYEVVEPTKTVRVINATDTNLGLSCLQTTLELALQCTTTFYFWALVQQGHFGTSFSNNW